MKMEDSKFDKYKMLYNQGKLINNFYKEKKNIIIPKYKFSDNNCFKHINNISSNLEENKVKRKNTTIELNKFKNFNDKRTIKYQILLFDNKKYKNLGDEILDDIFLDNNVSNNNNSNINTNISNPNEKNILKEKLSKINKNKKEKKSKLNLSNKNITLNANFKKSNEYKCFTNTFKTNKSKYTLKKYTLTAKLALSLINKNEVIDDYIDSSVKVIDHFSRFKRLLSEKKNENKLLLEKIYNDN